MSVLSIAKNAANRDLPKSDSADDDTVILSKETTADLAVGTLAAAVPTEIVALYTGVLGVLAGALVGVEDKMIWLRWLIYGVCIALTVITILMAYRNAAAKAGVTRSERRFPALELAAALFAFATWGLVVPESAIYYYFDAPELPIAIGVIATLSAAVLTIVFKPLLEKPVT